MTEYDSIIDRAANEAIHRCGDIVADDIRSVFWNREQFYVGNAGLGEPLEAVLPLEKSTIKKKRAIHAPYPDLPRVRSRALANSIIAEYGALSAEVFLTDRDSEKVEYQQETRPFFGFSRRALDQCEAVLKELDQKLDTELNKPGDLGEMTVTV